MKTKNLLDDCMDMLRSTDLTLIEIANGADVGSRWLSYLVAGKYKDPGVKRIQRIYNFLIRKKDSSSRKANKSNEMTV